MELKANSNTVGTPLEDKYRNIRLATAWENRY
jgi:hypothetical protein